MYIHKEGNRLLLTLLVIFAAITVLMVVFTSPLNFFNYLLIVLMFGFWIALASFFRIPRRVFTEDDAQLIAPADGTICTIEQTFEKEYLNCECLMVSVFMYGTDVHVNRYPANGTIDYVKYHKGNYFVASYPKSSIMNERASIGMVLEDGQKILMRQVAGVMARRIVCYAHEGEKVKQNQELGFIKFGSRVDLFLPLDTELCVSLQDTVRNGVTPIARIKQKQN
ncbi:MAG: phosphatidylserine decarboxylase family protein [Bacteroidales bacterium]|nr:phosphatidylserine decarboxylase family protein [Bacteroidales bacterium]